MHTENYLGRVLDRRYRIVEAIGAGGIAQVFRAEHVGTGRPLAVKIPKPEFRTNVEFIRRFQREAWLTTKLAHDNVVEVLDVQTEDACYIVMELLGGSDLETYLRRSGPLPWAQVRTIMLQICSALQYAHDLGVVHRDLKPANCFRLEPSGRIKVLDFGIARPLSPEDYDDKITKTGVLVGTLGYMAPEQFLGEFDTRSDIYGAGVIMFELLTGRRPFCSRGKELMQQVMDSPPPSLAAVRPDLDCPASVDAVVSRVLAKRPDARYASMEELAQAIAGCDAAPPTADDCDTSAVTLAFSRKSPPRRTLVGMPLLGERALAPRHAPAALVTPRPPPEPPAAPPPEPAPSEPVAQNEVTSPEPPATNDTTEHATGAVPGHPVAGAASASDAAEARASTHDPSGPASTLTMVRRRLGLGALLGLSGALAGAVVLLFRFIPLFGGESSPAPAAVTPTDPPSKPRERVSARVADPGRPANGPSEPPPGPPTTSLPAPVALDRPPAATSPLGSSTSEEPSSTAADATRSATPLPPSDDPGHPPAAAATNKRAPMKPSPEVERRRRHKTAENAIERVLHREQVGSSVSRLHVTARFSAEGEMLELDLHDGLPRGPERDRVEASLRKLRLTVGTDALTFNHTYDFPLPK